MDGAIARSRASAPAIPNGVAQYLGSSGGLDEDAHAAVGATRGTACMTIVNQVPDQRTLRLLSVVGHKVF